MWGKADDLRLSILMGLRSGLSLCRGMRRALTEDEQLKVAGAIVEHLEHSNWKIEHAPVRQDDGDEYSGQGAVTVRGVISRPVMVRSRR